MNQIYLKLFSAQAIGNTVFRAFLVASLLGAGLVAQVKAADATSESQAATPESQATIPESQAIAPSSAELEFTHDAMQTVPAMADLAEADPAPASNGAMESITSVSQLTDVRPTDWAFQALQSLVERYGCIVGYPDRTYRGNRSLSRYEFAAGVNACMNRIEELIKAGLAEFATKEDLLALQRLQEEFAAELATLRGRVDALEVRTTTLEKQQFSTTTKLLGEIAFSLADAFGGNGDDVETVFTDRVRLMLVSSFTGKDKLYTRLTAGNLGNSFAPQLGTQEGRFAYDGQIDNDVTIDRLHYVFPLGDKVLVTAMANGGGHHFYADTLNPGLEAGGGATGALSRFGERNPIYRFGLGGQGIGFRFSPTKSIDLYAGYMVQGGNIPAERFGLFDGNYSGLAELVFKPSKQFRIGLTYLNSYNVGTPASRHFNFGGTGTNLGNLSGAGLPAFITTSPVVSNSYGIQALFDVSPKFSIRGWFGYTNARVIGVGDAEILNYALILAFPDLGKKGNFGAIIVGAEPYLNDDISIVNVNVDVPFHIEVLYKYRVNDFITITPGIIWLTTPNQNNANEDVVIGTILTTFTF